MKTLHETLRGVKIEIKLSHKNEVATWKHYAWIVQINGEIFSYCTGLGFLKVPSPESVLDALFNDAECGEYSFGEFCGNLGYDTDSMKAFNTYMACQDTDKRLRSCLGAQYTPMRKEFETRRDAE